MLISFLKKNYKLLINHNFFIIYKCLKYFFISKLKIILKIIYQE